MNPERGDVGDYVYRLFKVDTEEKLANDDYMRHLIEKDLKKKLAHAESNARKEQVELGGYYGVDGSIAESPESNKKHRRDLMKTIKAYVAVDRGFGINPRISANDTSLEYDLKKKNKFGAAGGPGDKFDVDYWFHEKAGLMITQLMSWRLVDDSVPIPNIIHMDVFASQQLGLTGKLYLGKLKLISSIERTSGSKRLVVG